MAVLSILLRLEAWQVILTTVASSLTAVVSIYATIRVMVRRVQAFVQASAEALDARRHGDLVAMRADILTALDEITPGVGKFDQLKESELGSNGSPDG